MKSRFSLFFTLFMAATLAIGISGCETDVDLMAPYKSTPVIIGILDYKADTQFVRINRTYLGPGDATMYAQVKDSVEYSPSEVEAWLFKRRNGAIKDSIELKYIMKPSRDPGAFYNQNVGFYYTTDPLFTDQEIADIRQGTLSGSPVLMTYDIRVVARGKTFTATTNFPDLSESTITYPPFLGTSPIRIPMYQEVTSTYSNIEFKYKTGSETARYLGVYRINFDYVLTDGTTITDQHIDFKLGAQDNTEGTNNKDGGFVFNAASWYDAIGIKIKAIPNIKQVRIRDLEFRLTGANKMLTTYLKAANPVSEFSPVLNTVTNFDNDAIGIFASRTVIVRKTHLSEPSLKIMNQGEYTSAPGLSYCVLNWAGSEYVCNP